MSATITIGTQSACSHGRWDPGVETWRNDVRAWIVEQRDRFGYGWPAIADTLNAANVPTLSGGSEWRGTSVRSVYHHPTNVRGGDRR